MTHENARMLEGPVVVTGGSGFLGGAVIDQLLARGITDIRAIDLFSPEEHARRRKPDDRVRYFQRDLRSARLDEPFAGAQTALHLAACQYHTPLASSSYALPFFPVNVEGTRRVLDAAKTGGASQLVFVSSNMVYGLPQALPVSERHARTPIGPYGHSKLEAERLVERAQSGALSCAILRPGLIVGPGRTGVIDRVFGWIRAGRPVLVIGNADNRYEITHVDDVASLVLAAASHPGLAAFNCASAGVPTMREWIEAVKERAGSRSRIVGIPGVVVKPALRLLERARLAPLRKDQYLIADRDYYMDASLAKAQLGWAPRYTGVEAILDTYRWYVEEQSARGRCNEQ